MSAAGATASRPAASPATSDSRASLDPCRSLAVHYVNDHARAVDVGDLQPRNLGAAHARAAVEKLISNARSNRSLLASIRRATSSRLRILGSFRRVLGLGLQELAELMPTERAYEQEPQRRHMVLYRSRIQLLHCLFR